MDTFLFLLAFGVVVFLVEKILGGTVRSDPFHDYSKD